MDVAQFDPREIRKPTDDGLFFDRFVTGDLDGVVALYYTNELHVVPNPFSVRDIAPLGRVFPMNMMPFNLS